MMLAFLLVLVASCSAGPRPFASKSLNVIPQADLDMPEEYYFPFTDDSRISDSAVRDCAKGRTMTFVGGVVKAGSGFVELDGTQGGTVQTSTNGFFADSTKQYSIYMSFIAEKRSVLLSTGNNEPDIYIAITNDKKQLFVTTRGNYAFVNVTSKPSGWDEMFLSFVGPSKCILNFNGKETSFTRKQLPAGVTKTSPLFVGYFPSSSSPYPNMVGKIKALAIFSTDANLQANDVIGNDVQWRMRVARFAATHYCPPPTLPDTVLYVPGFNNKFVTGTRAEARSACEKGGDKLATILNEYQNQGAKNACHASKGCWIGVTISSGEPVTWMDGSEVMYNNFGSGEPSPGKNCAVITPSGEWKAESCGADRATICQVATLSRVGVAALDKTIQVQAWWRKRWLVASIFALLCCVVVIVPCVFLSRNKQGELKPLLPTA